VSTHAANTLACSGLSGKLLPSVIHDSLWLRRLAYLGARYGTTRFVTASPPVIGTLLSTFMVSQRRVVLQNLRRILGKRDFFSEQRDVARTFSQYASCLTEALGSERVRPQDMKFHLQGQPHLNTLMASHSGFVVLTAHTGAWDLASRHLQEYFKRPVMIAMQREANSAAREFQDTLRLRRGVEIAHVGESAFEGLSLLRHLRAGGVIAVQLDRMPQGSRELNAKLFGEEFCIPLGPFQLARLAKVPLVPVFCARLGYFEYEVCIGEPIRIEVRPTREQLKSAACQAASGLESFLQKYPTQWFNFVPARPQTNNRHVQTGEPLGS
jgi:phosphatidylinositol dimannoside acyltransferase